MSTRNQYYNFFRISTKTYLTILETIINGMEISQSCAKAFVVHD